MALSASSVLVQTPFWRQKWRWMAPPKDVAMEEAPAAEEKAEDAGPAPPSVADQLRAQVALIDKAVRLKETRAFGKLLRQTTAIRRQLTAADLQSFVAATLTAGWPGAQTLLQYLGPQVRCAACPARLPCITDFSWGGLMSAPPPPPTPANLHRRLPPWTPMPCLKTAQRRAARGGTWQQPARRLCLRWRCTPTCWCSCSCWTTTASRRYDTAEELCHWSPCPGRAAFSFQPFPSVLMVTAPLTVLPVPQAKGLAAAAVERLGAFNRRTLDVLASRVYSYLSLAHEKTGTLAEIRRSGAPALTASQLVPACCSSAVWQVRGGRLVGGCLSGPAALSDRCWPRCMQHAAGPTPHIGAAARRRGAGDAAEPAAAQLPALQPV